MLVILTGLAVFSSAAIGKEPVKEDYFEVANREEGGEAVKGKALFSDARLNCSQCHTVDGSSGRAGPDLSAVGDKFSRADLIRAVMEPSSTIAVGYGLTLVTKKSGEAAAGVIKQATGEWLELMGADARTVRVNLADIARQETSPVSLMPEGLHAAVSPAEFADLIAYLASLHQPRDPNRDEVIPQARRPVGLVPFFSDKIRFAEPLCFLEIPGQAGRYLVLEHGGGIWLAEKMPDGETRKEFLNLRSVVRVGGATGLLNLAFHPKFAENHRYFVLYQIVEDRQISTLLVERKFNGDFSGDSGEEPKVLMKIPGTTQDHNGGSLGFGPDGFLYLGMGDTGPQRDPQGHGQDLGMLLGKILRVDVDHQDSGLPYAVPQDNPFRDRSGVRPEIFAYGFREPWRLSFDSETRDLWVGDVGQDRYEEVGIVRKGENHGWNVIEGDHPFSETFRRSGETFVPPVFSYSHRVGVSVTGGYVYRGRMAPKMKGRYVFGDHETRRLWALTQKDRVKQDIVEIGRAPTRAVSFSEGSDGELFLVGFNDGVIYRMNLSAVDPRPVRLNVLAETAEKAPVIWKYSLARPDDKWADPEFDDGAWSRGAAGFGTPNTPGTVLRTDWHGEDLWLRREFTVSRPSGALTLRIHHDEDAEVYLNGVEIAKLDRWTQGYVDIPLPPEAAKALKQGRNVLAVHCHQNTGGQYVDAGLLESVDDGE